jgi:hypothetical protein
MIEFGGHDAGRYIKIQEQDIILLCPACGSEYSHVERVGTTYGTDKYEAGVYPGTKAIRHTGWRRSGVEIVCSCESCLELFSLVLQQHKGQNFILVRKDMGKRSDDDSRIAERLEKP